MTPNISAIRQQSTFLDACYRVVDGVAILLGLWLAVDWSHVPFNSSHQFAVAAAIALFYVVAEITGVYRNWRGVSTQREVGCGMATWGASLIGLILVGILTGHAQSHSLLTAWYWLWFTPGLMVLMRVAIRLVLETLRARGLNFRGFAIVGVNPLGMQLAANIRDTPDLGLKFVGFFDDRPQSRLPEIPASLGSQVGDIANLVERARRGEVEQIYITFPMRAEERIRKVLAQLSDSTASVYIVPDFFVFELLHSRWTDVRGLPVVSVFENPLYGVDGLMKRTTDIVFGSLILLFCALPMLAIALAIKLTSAGPIFFRQRRYGLDGREFYVWKFRTMTVCEDGPKITQATQNDKRLTSIGGFLRRTSLDELPQLFNVLYGDMSLVGPRPHATAHNEEYRKVIQGYMLRHKIKPGITGLAQVRGWRGETDTLEKMERRIECDHEYIRTWSIWNDIRILLQTVSVVLLKKNAY
ncbi:undecaprenyl-phosphate glucose phosphotransferase [Blastopirellula sp. JC732]|uniref:Undecaprenyl-phosphate glucose phosphotransferase n=1 Tax=Blastopirellula sediminis TaxID=2894196 RepID=A0A9X1MRY7_9BACT|nr:undecaprenyl-phosphate glucose phosphotransferase [Blastopirellula sediminis]MCC9605034.1 undecaprenyl-phosphate glucose phosphotransferase [Blastopirellula sediminis]MCC9631666.1 undecaprenyl-phosphate glucose phosphotransferase [Blastopirellula sediminis]